MRAYTQRIVHFAAMGARVHASPHHLYASRTLCEIVEVLRLACFTTTSSRATISQANTAQPSRRSSSLTDVRTVQDLPFRNNELADAVAKDRAMARVRLYERLMPAFQETHLQPDQLGLAKPRSAIQQSQLDKFEVRIDSSVIIDCTTAQQKPRQLSGWFVQLHQ